MRKSSTFFADIQIKNTAHALTTEEVAALEILRGTGVNIVEAALVARAELEAGRYKVKRAMKCVALGAEELKRQEKTVSFEKAVEAALEARKGRRARTQSDYRYWIDKLRVTIDPPPLKLRRGKPAHRRATLCRPGDGRQKTS